MRKTTIVVPCFNEQHRLQPDEFGQLLRDDIHLLFVDDGSTDATPAAIETIRQAHPGRVAALRLEHNQGKAEAVRLGMRMAIDQGAIVTGYVDADLATPVPEVLRLIDRIHQDSAAVVMGSRVVLLGTDIRRRRRRHFVGRVFATAASIVLDLPVYDTQCGAKFFRVSPTLSYALQDRFVSRWSFDVELIGRLLTGGDGVPPLVAADFVEVPLQQWIDVTGSKLRPAAMVKAGLDLIRIAQDLRQRRS